MTAIKAGLSEIPCWVTEMDDDTAYMELVKANNQGELLALEIGIHALETVNDKAKKGGGIRAYAEAVGKSETSLKQWIGAADVYSSLCKTFYTNELNEKPSHLYEISKVSSEHWQILTDLLIKCDWSVKDVQAAVMRVKSVVLLEWMTADFKEIATVPATAKRIENAIAEISASLEKLSTATLLLQNHNTNKVNFAL